MTSSIWITADHQNTSQIKPQSGCCFPCLKENGVLRRGRLIVAINCMLTVALIVLVSTTYGLGQYRLNHQNNNQIESNDGIVYDPTTNRDIPTTVPPTTTITSFPTPTHCPSGLFQCPTKPKINTIHLQSTTSNPSFVCIDYSRVCDGILDCPGGEDESVTICLPTTTTTQASTTTTQQDTGCYLCRGTADQCIPMSLLCNHQNDCPESDDESNPVCGRISSNSNLNVESNFQIKQSGSTNIYIINNKTGSSSEHHHHHDGNGTETNDTRINPNFHLLGNREQEYNNLESSTESPSDDQTDKPQQEDEVDVGRQNVGFMFHVDNFVVYNSELKMFNQDSENISPHSNNGTNQNQTRQQQNQFDPNRYQHYRQQSANQPNN